MKILLEVLKAHLILVNLGVFEAVLNLVQSYLPANHFEHHQNVLRHQIAFPKSESPYFYRSKW